MKIILARPPNFEEIAAVLPEVLVHHGVFYCYGDTIYNPDGVVIAPQIMCHESVHAQRQGKTEEEIRWWWTKYLNDPAFRLEEELLAHRAEYRAYKGMVPDHRKRFDMLHAIAERLSNPLYGGVIGYAQARRLILVDVYANKVAKLRREGATA